jgi:CTD kinase subunit beta
MAPVKDETENGRIGPPTSFIQVAKPYIFEQTIQECLKTTGVSQAREDTIRLAGVQWIDSVRKALKLWETFVVERRRNADMNRPVRTFDTAVIYYHKFRLVHTDTEYSYAVRMAW